MVSGRRVLVAALSALVVSGVVVPAAGAEPSTNDYPVVGGVVRDNVDKAHAPLPEEYRTGGTRAAAPAADYVRGIDVARFQHGGGDINWTQVAGSGIRFVGVKATEGNYYTNSWYRGDMDGARAAGMYAFPYHFGTPNDTDGVTQADYFLDNAPYTLDGRTLPPVLDVEHNPYLDYADRCYDKTAADLVTWIRDFLTEVKRRTGVTPILYTTPFFWSECVGNSTAFSAYPLWIAHHDIATPSVPSGWAGNWSFWQYSDTTTVPGIVGDVDGDYVSGGEAMLEALAGKAGGYTPTTPTRVLDTRTGSGPLGPGGVVTVDLSGRLPATASAVVLNVTGIASAPTFVTAWPASRPRPNASNLNLVAGDVRPNLVTVQVGQDRKVSLYNNTGSTNLLADLAGYYATDGTGLFTAQSPRRVLDTRTGLGWSPGPVGPQGTITLNLSNVLPATATAVTLNLTGVDATTGTYVSVWPTGESRPNVSNLNLSNANATPNLVTVKLGDNWSVNLYNNTGAVNLVADLAGYYASDKGSKFVALAPQRLLDTRGGNTAWTSVPGGGQAIPLSMASTLPAKATGVILNVTGIAPTANTFVSVTPRTSTTPTRPESSNLNLVAGQTVPNLVSVGVGTAGDVWLFNNAGSINLLADLAGYFAP